MLTDTEQSKLNKELMRAISEYSDKNNNLTEIETLINRGADVNYIGVYGCGDETTPLRLAFQKYSVNLMKFLLKYPNIDVNYRYIEYTPTRQSSSTLLFMSSQKCKKTHEYLLQEENERIAKNDIAMMQALLDHPNIDVNCGNGNGNQTVLHQLAEVSNSESLKMIRTILAHPKIDINKVDGLRNTPLQYAIKKIKEHNFGRSISIGRTFMYLINAGANIYNDHEILMKMCLRNATDEQIINLLAQQNFTDFANLFLKGIRDAYFAQEVTGEDFRNDDETKDKDLLDTVIAKQDGVTLEDIKRVALMCKKYNVGDFYRAASSIYCASRASAIVPEYSQNALQEIKNAYQEALSKYKEEGKVYNEKNAFYDQLTNRVADKIYNKICYNDLPKTKNLTDNLPKVLKKENVGRKIFQELLDEVALREILNYSHILDFISHELKIKEVKEVTDPRFGELVELLAVHIVSNHTYKQEQHDYGQDAPLVPPRNKVLSPPPLPSRYVTTSSTHQDYGRSNS